MRKILVPILAGAALAIGGCNPGESGNASAAKSQARIPERPSVRRPPPTDRAEAATPELGRCYAESCSWSITKSRTTVRQDDSGTLVRLSVLGGSSPNDNDEDPPRIQWNAKPHEVYVFCSKTLPAVIMKSDVPPEALKASGGHRFPPYQVDVLDFVNGIPGALESGASLFARTCYPNEDWADPGFAQRHGLAAFDDEPDVAITSPEDIFRVAGARR